MQGIWDSIKEKFDFVSGANDALVIKHANGQIYATPFVVQTNASTINRHYLGSPVKVFLNGRHTELAMHIGDDGRCVFQDKTANPDPAVLRRLPLRDGRNSLDFRINDLVIASAGLFAWRNTDKVVIVDIDGTVTRTDAGGVLASSEFGQSIGLLHAHDGVCEVLSYIASGGYRLLFLTARPITRSEATKKYLNQIGQEEKIPMPEGALMTSAMGTLNTVVKVWGDLKGYKLSVLQEIQQLFDGTERRSEPCYAGGFGNHDYDMKSYLEAGCPEQRCFLLDEDSNVTVYGSDVSYKGYRGMLTHLSDLFPPVVVVQWQQHHPRSVPTPSDGMGGAPNSFSINKIPGAALLGEGLGKVWGGVASTTSTMTQAAGNSLQSLPGAHHVTKMHQHLPKMPDLPQYGGLGAENPPQYDDPEAQGLVDRGD
mmetsp:Transcript_14586/g.34594  ORF Transcript_14586/g.34594 Transcript_14586/m.34594 type:complete len:425 (-) Transcript_14586:134-1408(-)